MQGEVFKVLDVPPWHCDVILQLGDVGGFGGVVSARRGAAGGFRDCDGGQGGVIPLQCCY